VLRRTRKIPTPLNLPARKSVLSRRQFRICAAPPGDLLLPLAEADLTPPQPLVAPGQMVDQHQPIARRGDLILHSPLPGEAADVQRADTQFACDLPALRLRAKDAPPVPALKPTRCAQAESSAAPATGESSHAIDSGDLPAVAYSAGIFADLEGQPQPLGTILRNAQGQVDALIVNAVQSEPYLCSHHRLLLEQPPAVAVGIRALAAFLGIRQPILAVDAARRTHRNLAETFAADGINVVPVRTSFPGDHPHLLAKHLLGRPIPPGRTCLDARCLVLPVDAVWHLGLYLASGVPAAWRPVTLAGDCLQHGGMNAYLPVGMTIRSLLEWLGSLGALIAEPGLVVLGGPLTGTSVSDPERTVVSGITGCVLVMHSPPRTDPIGCIRCGWCIEDCPAGLEPIRLLEDLERGRTDETAASAALACLECRLCSYVCPSHLPLAEAVMQLKNPAGRDSR